MQTTACPVDRLDGMKTLSERIDWILQNRLAPDGQPWQAKALSRAADLSETVVGMIHRGDQTNSKIDTIEAIARTAGVSAAWLAFGLGSPDGDALGSVVRFRDIEGWGELLASAKALAESTGRAVPEWAWEAISMDAPSLTTAPSIADICELGVFYHQRGWGRPGTPFVAAARNLRVV